MTTNALTWVDFLCLIMALLNFRILGASQLASSIGVVAAQGVVLALLPLFTAHQVTSELFSVILLALVFRGVVMPLLLRRSLRFGNVQREERPIVGFTASMFAGVLLLGVCLVIAQPLQRALPLSGSLALPAALFTICCGLFLLIARRAALLQALGYLVMENGIFCFGVAFAVHEPMLVEMGILLDVFLAVFVMSSMIHNISDEFNDLDTDVLSELKD